MPRSRKLYVSELIKRYNGHLLIAILDRKHNCGYVYEQGDRDIYNWYDYQVKRFDTTVEYLRIYI